MPSPDKKKMQDDYERQIDQSNREYACIETVNSYKTCRYSTTEWSLQGGLSQTSIKNYEIYKLIEIYIYAPNEWREVAATDVEKSDMSKIASTYNVMVIKLPHS